MKKKFSLCSMHSNTGDSTALEYISDEMYVQHNLAFPDGKAVLANFFTGNPTGVTSTNARIFSDGDIVVSHNVYGGVWNNGTPQVAFDIFRFHDGLIVEHWDNLQDLADPAVDPVNGNTQTDGPAIIDSSANTEANRGIVQAMLQEMFIQNTWSAFPKYFDTTNYIQHSPGTPNGTDFLASIPDGIPFYSSIHYVYASGNFVLSMSEGIPDSTGLASAYFDLFRLDDGLIVEHWDVIQTIPDASTWANSNGKWGLTNEEKALALIDAFNTGDSTALDYVSDSMYIQHNLSVPDGKDAIKGFFPGSPIGLSATNARVFTDGDIVFTHSVYGGIWNNGTPQVAFDVFRFENGFIVEHWDNLQNLTDPEIDPVNMNTQTDGPTQRDYLADTEANKSLVEAMAQEMFIQGTWSSYVNYYSPNYIQHSPGIPNGTGIFTMFPDGLPFYNSVEYVYAERNFVLLMSEGFPDSTSGLANAYYDLFRLDSGLIVEHWDVVQTIPEENEWANDNGKWGSDALTAIQNIVETDLTIYPNPVQSVLNIEGEDFTRPSSLNIRNISGKLILSLDDFTIPGKIDVESLNPGFYILEVIGWKRKQRYSRKFVKHKH